MKIESVKGLVFSTGRRVSTSLTKFRHNHLICLAESAQDLETLPKISEILVINLNKILRACVFDILERVLSIILHDDNAKKMFIELVREVADNFGNPVDK